MAQIQISKIRVRRGQELQTGIPQLDAGEFGWAEDTEHLYIGKRIVEGAVDDNNSRILTENDLNNIFSLIGGGGAIASTSSYQYREGVDYIHSSTSTIAIKLDNWVSLTDYGVVETSTATDITIQFQNAINDLFFQGLSSGADTFDRTDARRRLIIPAGNYIVSEQIPLPPYTSLVGEGPGLTTITFAPSGEQTAMFTTVDATGNNFVVGDGSLPYNPAINNGLGAREIHIEGMTLQYVEDNILDWPLISLQEVVDVSIKNVYFTTQNISTFTNHGVAIEIRSSIVSDLEIAPAGNISIENCKFENLNAAVTQTTGTVNRFYFNNNVFDNLQSGISMWNPDVTVPGISNGVIDSNRFEQIVGSAIVIGTSTYSAYAGNTVSSNNVFRNVGNGVGQTDYTVVPGYPGASPVIEFNSYGNSSINDKFSRKDVAASIPDTSNFYYTPLVLGRTEVSDASTFNVELASGDTDIIKIPTTGSDQVINLRYSMVDLGGTQYSRKGTLIVNIVGGEVDASSISDYYNYSSSTDYVDPTFYVATYNINGFVTLVCTNTTGLIFNFEYQSNLMLS